MLQDLFPFSQIVTFTSDPCRHLRDRQPERPREPSVKQRLPAAGAIQVGVIGRAKVCSGRTRLTLWWKGQLESQRGEELPKWLLSLPCLPLWNACVVIYERVWDSERGRSGTPAAPLCPEGWLGLSRLSLVRFCHVCMHAHTIGNPSQTEGRRKRCCCEADPGKKSEVSCFSGNIRKQQAGSSYP